MSGPKLVGITCDPEIIAQNNARLQEVGKNAYYSDLFASLNTDIANTQKWVEKYGIETIKSIEIDKDINSEELSGALRQLDEFKKRTVIKIEKEKLEFRIINKKSIDELNDISCEKIEEIPRWKESFIREVSVYMKEIQEAYNVYKKKKNEITKKIEEINKEMEKVDSKIKSIYASKEILSINKIESFGNYTEVMSDLSTKREVIPEQETIDQHYTIEELAVMDMLKNELEMFEKTDDLNESAKELIKKFKKSLEALNDEKNYTIQSRKKILYLMLGDYQRITKQIAQLNCERYTRSRFRRSMELEYVSFCDALDIRKEDYIKLADNELEQKVNILREKVKRQEERIYIEDSLTDIMEKFHYKSISATYLHDSEKTSQIVFSDNGNHLINSFFGDGAVMLQVVGEGNQPPNESETREQVEEQGAFCALYPEIKSELEKRKIHINTENCAPVSSDSVANIVIEKQTDIQKTTRRYSIVRRKPQYNNDTYEVEVENRHLAMEV